MDLISEIGGLCGAAALLLSFFRMNVLEKRINKIENSKKDSK